MQITEVRGRVRREDEGDNKGWPEARSPVSQLEPWSLAIEVSDVKCDDHVTNILTISVDSDIIYHIAYLLK